MFVENLILCIAMALMANPGCSHMSEPKSYSRFEYEYKVLQKLVDLENTKKEQNQTLVDVENAKKEQNQKLVGLENANREQKQINDEQMKKNSDLETEIDNIKNVSSEYKEANKELKAVLKVERNAIQSLSTRFDNLSRASKDTEPRPFYGFSAYESASSTASMGSTIVLRRTHLNEGGSYNTGTGLFTAPIDGMYIFHATLCIHSGGKHIFVTFMAGEEVLGRFAAVDTYDSCHSGSALARLQKGSQVCLRVTHASSGSTLRDDGHRMNSFSGFLVGM